MILILTSHAQPHSNQLLLQDKLTQHDSPTTIASFQDLELSLSSKSINISIQGQPLNTWSTIYLRTVGKYSGIAHILAVYAKTHKLFLIDQFHANNNSQSKLAQMFHLAQDNLPIPKTYYSPAYNSTHLGSAIQYLKLPIIIKQCNTSRGLGVARAHNLSELKDTIQSLTNNSPNKDIILQEFIDNTFEYRILITGQSIAVAEKKTRTVDGEFRNNVHLGATEEFFNPKLLDNKIAKLAVRAAIITQTQVAGVDITEDSNGNPYIFEVNSSPDIASDDKISNSASQLARYLSLCDQR